jgi:hypothetical protein
MKRFHAEAVLLWRAKGRVHGLRRELRCTLEQLGEGCFELRMSSGDELVSVETFTDAAQLLSRAEKLRAEAHQVS